MKNPLSVAMIGYQFMGKAHSQAFREVGSFFPRVGNPTMKVICGRTKSSVEKAREELGWEEAATQWKKVIQRDDIDIVDIATPGHLHKKIAIAAAQAGKHILCEKPLANNLRESVEMLQAAEKAGVCHMVAFNYRRVPAICLAKKMIEQGRLGQIYHWRANYLQDWIVDPNFPLVWRLQKSKAGTGPHGDLNAHIIDLAHYLVGDIEEVIGQTETFVKERPLPDNFRKKGRVTVEDAAQFLARFDNGVLGTFEATRMATGRKNFLQFEINGSEGSLLFNLERLNELQFFSRKDRSGQQGFRNILVTEPTHPYLQAWWPPGHIIGWQHTFVHEVADFLTSIEKQKPVSPDFYDGVKCQAVLEAVTLSQRRRKWIRPASLYKLTRRES